MKIWYMLFLITYPAGIALFLLWAYKNKWLELNHSNLFKQKLFWLAIVIPLMTFITFGCWAWWGKSPALNAHGFERFLTISKLPLLFLAASVPLVSIVNNVHRTKQTEKQILESEKKNNADLYFTHFKHTIDLFNEITSKQLIDYYGGEKHTFKIKNKIALYNYIFNNSTPENGLSYDINPEVVKTIKDKWDIINTALKDINKIKELYPSLNMDSQESFTILLSRAEEAYLDICITLKINTYRSNNRMHLKVQDNAYVTLFSRPSVLIEALKSINSICSQIADIINSEKINKFVDHYDGFLQQKIEGDIDSFILSTRMTEAASGWEN